MNRRRSIPFFLVLLSALGGCTTVGTHLGELSPERDRGAQLAAAVAAPERPSFSNSMFCPEPLRELYMVMPESNGHVGRLQVTFDDGSQLLLEGAYASAEKREGRTREFTADQQTMEREFGAALAALPDAPLVATLYFRFGTTELNESSKANVEYVFKQIMSLPEPEVRIIGHTDTVGPAARNRQLSQSRAERVRDQLVGMGLPPERVTAVVGKGETELQVPTGDNVKEEKNRRVEIIIR